MVGAMSVINFPSAVVVAIPSRAAYPAGRCQPVAWPQVIKAGRGKISRRVGGLATYGNVISW
jgi:hypothetical protein